MFLCQDLKFQHWKYDFFLKPFFASCCKVNVLFLERYKLILYFDSLSSKGLLIPDELSWCLTCQTCHLGRFLFDLLLSLQLQSKLWSLQNGVSSCPPQRRGRIFLILYTGYHSGTFIFFFTHPVLHLYPLNLPLDLLKHNNGVTIKINTVIPPTNRHYQDKKSVHLWEVKNVVFVCGWGPQLSVHLWEVSAYGSFDFSMFTEPLTFDLKLGGLRPVAHFSKVLITFWTRSNTLKS